MGSLDVDGTVMLFTAVVIALTGLMVALRAPQLAVIGWICVIAFVPIWWGADFLGYWYPGTIAGVGVILVLLRKPSWGRITGSDLAVAGFFIATLAPVLVKGAWSAAAMFAVVTQWVIAYLVGRLALSAISRERLYGVIGVVFGVVAALAILEFLFGSNLFVSAGGRGPMWTAWHDIQFRGGLPRAEGAWGHSIALGAALSMSIPLLLASRLKTGVKVGLLLVMLGGVVITFSRIGQVAAVLALVLSLYAMAPIMRRGLKAGTALVILVGGIMGYSYITGVYSSTGDEFSKSAAYRGDLFSLVQDIAPFGQSPAVGQDGLGQVNFDGFESIDNALLLLGLRHGWLALGIAALLLAIALVAVILRRAEPPTVAIATQIPTLFSVALITQFSMYFWFMAGLAVAAHAHREHRKKPRESAASVPPPGIRELEDIWREPRALTRV